MKGTWKLAMQGWGNPNSLWEISVWCFALSSCPKNLTFLSPLSDHVWEGDQYQLTVLERQVAPCLYCSLSFPEYDILSPTYFVILIVQQVSCIPTWLSVWSARGQMMRRALIMMPTFLSSFKIRLNMKLLAFPLFDLVMYKYQGFISSIVRLHFFYY